MTDLYSVDAGGKKHPDAERCLTDGAGLINSTAVRSISQAMGYEPIPAAFQARIAGSKGVWLRAVPGHAHLINVDSPEPCITITASQHKIQVITSGDDSIFARANTIFNLVKPSKPAPSVSLNKQIILCLWFGGVKPFVFGNLLETGLKTATAPFMAALTSSNDINSLCLLSNAIEKAGNLASARSRDFLAGQARAQGFGQAFHGDEDLEADSNTTFMREPYSGAPLNLYVTALELLSNGFHPHDCPKLLEVLHYIIKNVIVRFSEDFHLYIENAVEAFAVPGEYNTSPLSF
jgi:RNA-dependent RNA polymerase